jgi:tryptophanyl-tRNA synthetase
MSNHSPRNTFPSAPGPKTPGTIADELSKLDFPAPSGFAFSPARVSANKGVVPASINVPGNTNSQSALSTDHQDPEDLTEQLSSLALPEPEQLASAREHKRRESVSDQLSADLAAMRLPEPERIFGGQGTHDDGTAVGVSSKGGIDAADWYKIKLADGEEVPEAVRKGSMEGITSPVTSPIAGDTGRFEGPQAKFRHSKGQPSLSRMMEVEEERGTE